MSKGADKVNVFASVVYECQARRGRRMRLNETRVKVNGDSSRQKDRD